MSTQKPSWVLPFAVLSGMVLAFSLYIVVVDQDLNAIFVGLVIVIILYAVFRYVGRLLVVR